jgi:hypothetical protein
MKKQYKIQLPKGKKVTLTNVGFEDGVMTVNVELEKDDSNIWDKMIQEYGEAICGKKEQKYEPKDGDFVKIKQEGKLYFTPDLGIGYSEKEPSIGIFKSIEMDKGNELLFCYITLIRDSQYEVLLPLEHEGHTYSVGEVSNLKVSPATEEEKKLLIEKLAEVGKRWNEGKKCLENVRWRAKKGKLYRWVSADGYVKESTDEHGECDNCYYNSGNYFKTEEAAEKIAEQIREIFKNSKAE